MRVAVSTGLFYLSLVIIIVSLMIMFVSVMDPDMVNHQQITGKAVSNTKYKVDSSCFDSCVAECDINKDLEEITGKLYISDR